MSTLAFSDYPSIGGNPGSEQEIHKPSPYLYTYVTANTPYKFTDYNSESTDASKIYGGLGNLNGRYRYVVGYDGAENGQRYPYLMSKPSINYMSVEITKKLIGVHPEGKNIIIPDVTIREVAESMFEANPLAVDVLQEMTINYIVNTIKVEYETIQQNNNLNIWEAFNYGSASGLHRFADIKLNKKMRTNNMQWKY